MVSKVKEQYSDWYKNIDKNKYYLVLSNDIDSYLSCLFLKKKFGVEIGGFYDFEALYINSKLTEGKEPIYVDADIMDGLAFGNHPTALKNKNTINLNCNISEKNYTDKFAGSTLMTLYSLYDVDLRKYAPYKIQLLLTVDVWFKQFFRFRDKWDYWTKQMGMEYLTDIITEYDMTEEAYYNTLIDYGFNRDIHIYGWEGNYDLGFNLDYDALKEDLNITIPKPTCTFDKKILDLHIGQGDYFKLKNKKDRIFSNAMTYKGQYRYSYI